MTRNQLISLLADGRDVVLKVHSTRRNLYTLRTKLQPLDPDMIESLIGRGVLIPEGKDLFGGKDAQTYALSPDRARP